MEQTQSLLEQSMRDNKNFWDQIDKFLLRYQYDHAYALIRRKLMSNPGDTQLKRSAAQALGAKVEYALNLADQLAVKPDTFILKEYLERAILTDENMADSYWYLAVLHARFMLDFKAAQLYLQHALFLGYKHPLVPDLTDLIETGLGGSYKNVEKWSHHTRGAHELRILIWRLITWPDLTYPAALNLVSDNEKNLSAGFSQKYYIFNVYRRIVTALLEQAIITQKDVESCLEIAGLYKGPAEKYTTDLLRSAAEKTNNPVIWKQAAEAHLKILNQLTLSETEQKVKTGEQLENARKTAKKALIMVSALPFEIDPALHADILLSYAGTFSRSHRAKLKVELDCYLKALEYKQTASSQQDTSEVKKLISALIKKKVKSCTTLSLEELETAFTAACRIRAKDLTLEVADILSREYRNLNLPQNAITLNEELLQYKWLNKKETLRITYELATGHLEAQDAIKALEIYESLIARGDKLPPSINQAELWMNKGKGFKLQGESQKAEDSFKTALGFIKPSPGNGGLLQKAQIIALLGETECQNGNYLNGIAHLKMAETIYQTQPKTPPSLAFHTTAARSYYLAGDLDHCAGYIKKIKKSLNWNLSLDPSFSMWKGLLSKWADIHDYDVELELLKAKKRNIQPALLAAEQAKGKLHAWLRNYYAREDDLNQLEEVELQKALKTAETWVQEKNGRVIISFYLAAHGLGILALGNGRIQKGKWIKDFQYAEFYEKLYLPWKRFTGEFPGEALPVTEKKYNPATEILKKIGGWLGETLPELAAGGEELILIPHRLFAELPLSCTILPGGKSLVELFSSVSRVPCLYDLAELLECPTGEEKEGTPAALADPDSNLPFSRVTAALVTSEQNINTGEDFNIKAINNAVQTAPLLFLGGPAEVNKQNPWQSNLKTARGDYKIYDILFLRETIRTHTLLLGTCPTGQTQAFHSSGIVSLPDLFLQAGISRIIAPLWPVNDFTSLLFFSRFLTFIQKGLPAGKAHSQALIWLGNLNCHQAAGYISTLLKKLVKKDTDFRAVLKLAIKKLQQKHRELTSRPEDQALFNSPLDWACFELYGVPENRKK